MKKKKDTHLTEYEKLLIDLLREVLCLALLVIVYLMITIMLIG